MGREFLSYTGLVFEYWHALKAGELTPEVFRAWMAPVRVGFEELLHDVLVRISGGITVSQLDELLPENWIKDQPGA